VILIVEARRQQQRHMHLRIRGWQQPLWERREKKKAALTFR